MTKIRNADKYLKKKIPTKRVFGYADKAVASGNVWESHRLGVRRPVSAAANSDLRVREKARDRNEGWASPGCRCIHRGSSLGCGRARLCSLEIRKGNYHISPHPPAPLWCCLGEKQTNKIIIDEDTSLDLITAESKALQESGAEAYRACGGDCVALLSLWYPDPLARAPFICSWRMWGREWNGMLPIEAGL